MAELIGVNEERCIGCNACIRVCPSPEANSVKILENGKAVTAINSDKCIACGECIKVCKAKARDYDDDIDKFFKDLKERKGWLKNVTPYRRRAGWLEWRIMSFATGRTSCIWRYRGTERINGIIQNCILRCFRRSMN